MSDAIWTPSGTFRALAWGAPGAPVVLCLHGFPDHAPSWAPVAERLAAAGHRVVAPWMRGYWPSIATGPYDIDRLAADVVELADAVSPGRPLVLVGHDWGAVATYPAVARAPGRFCAAVTMSVPHPLAFVQNLPRQPAQLRRSWYMGFFQLRGVAERVLPRRDHALVDRLWRAWSPGYTPDPAAMRALKDCLARSLPAPILYYRQPLRWPSRALRSRIEVPLLHLHGEDDGCIGYAAGRGQERFFAGRFSSELVARAGHFLQLERPQVIAERILDWMRGV